MEIIPAILETGFDAVSARLSLARGHARTVQLDVCDGVFVPSITWPFITPPGEGKALNLDAAFKSLAADESEMPYWEDFDFELDLMVADAKRLLPQLLAVGPSRVIFHYASLADPAADLEALATLLPGMVQVGIAIGLDADPSLVFPLVDAKLVSFVQCMGIAKIGFQGQPHDPAALEKTCANLRALRERYPDLPLSVDGGVSRETAAALSEAGATRLVAGSAVFGGGDVAANIAALQKVLQ